MKGSPMKESTRKMFAAVLGTGLVVVFACILISTTSNYSKSSAKPENLEDRYTRSTASIVNKGEMVVMKVLTNSTGISIVKCSSSTNGTNDSAYGVYAIADGVVTNGEIVNVIEVCHADTSAVALDSFSSRINRTRLAIPVR